jgi:hypothetical protein
LETKTETANVGLESDFPGSLGKPPNDHSIFPTTSLN